MKIWILGSPVAHEFYVQFSMGCVMSVTFLDIFCCTINTMQVILVLLHMQSKFVCRYHMTPLFFWIINYNWLISVTDITNHPVTDITLHIHYSVLPTGKLHQNFKSTCEFLFHLNMKGGSPYYMNLYQTHQIQHILFIF